MKILKHMLQWSCYWDFSGKYEVESHINGYWCIRPPLWADGPELEEQFNIREHGEFLFRQQDEAAWSVRKQVVWLNPRSLLGLKLLESVLLQYNYSKGPIPEFYQSSLRVFNVSNNDLNGWIPTTHSLQSFGPDSYSSDPQLYGPPTLNTCKNIFATVDVADDQNRENSPAEPPGQSSVPNSAKIFVGLIAVGFVVAILLFFIYFKKARKLQKKGSRKVEERRGGEQQHGTWFFDGLEDEEKPVKSIEEKKGKGVDIEEEKKEAYFHRRRSRKLHTEWSFKSFC